MNLARQLAPGLFPRWVGRDGWDPCRFFRGRNVSLFWGTQHGVDVPLEIPEEENHHARGILKKGRVQLLYITHMRYS